MHILIVEDEKQLGKLLKRVLTEERHVVDVADEGYEGLNLALSDSYDLVILDRMLPNMDGLEICRQMRQSKIKSVVLMLTARGSVEDRVSGLTSGADDYLVKPFAMSELLARVQALLRRRDRETEGNNILQVGNLTLDLVRHEVQREGKLIELTAKEFALLEYLMRHPGQVLTRSQITDQVWRYDLDAISNVVDIYIHYLRDKIDHGFARPLLKTVRGIGYKLEAS
ncbi:MAG: response regulator transcription factor [Chloroflexi bacterium]|nr:response regulator transcription factor [Chloroflexota bacterium]OJV99817.1 MAG: DNA-binding response regulator [Chloroflexi bacterium 54-19]